MRILSIETSCDETAIAVLKQTGTSFTIEGHTVASQIKLHEQYGGVFPMMAKREHAKNIVPVLIKPLKESGLLKEKKQTIPEKTLAKLKEILTREEGLFELFSEFISSYQIPKIDRIAVTVGPGLTPALWVGISFAKALAVAWDLKIVPVNHMEGHVLSIFPEKVGTSFKIPKTAFPLISLLVSGGHTEIVLVKDWGKYKVIGNTRDDAAGEAFDKVARMLDLTYPGGPLVSKLAAEARKENLESTITLPRPMMYTKDFDFSFSGLKTSVLYLTRELGTLSDIQKKEIAREFEDSVVDVLIHKTKKAAEKYKATKIIVGGGVAANVLLRSRLTKEAGIEVIFPPKDLTSDNAIMIALAATFGKEVSITSKKLIAQGNMEL